MTELLKHALAEVGKLTQSEQDTIAALILDEIADERQWDEAFARSQSQLAKLAEKVRGDIAAGQVRDIGTDEL
jgi:hypothetical protein